MFNLVSEWFLHRLSELGYDISPDHIYWSLSCCQGDGVAFETRNLEIETLVRRWTSDRQVQDDVLAAVRDEDIWFEIRQHGNYTHAHSMTVEMQDNRSDPDEDASAHELLARQRQQKRLEEFLSWLEKDVRDTSNLLESEGYRLIECAWPRERNGSLAMGSEAVLVDLVCEDLMSPDRISARVAAALRGEEPADDDGAFRIEIVEREDPCHPKMDASSYEECLAVARDVIDGKRRRVFLVVRILSVETDCALAEVEDDAFIDAKDPSERDRMALALLEEALDGAVAVSRAALAIA